MPDQEDITLFGPDYEEDGTEKRGLEELTRDTEDARDDSRKHAQETSSFTDSDNDSFDKGAKGYAQEASSSASDAEGHAQEASSSASDAEGHAQEASSSASDASDSADTASEWASKLGGPVIFTPAGGGEDALFSSRYYAQQAEAQADNLSGFVEVVDGTAQMAVSDPNGNVFYYRDADGRVYMDGVDMDVAAKLTDLESASVDSGGGGGNVSPNVSLADHLTKHSRSLLTTAGTSLASMLHVCTAVRPPSVDDGLPGRIRLVVGADHISGSGGGAYLYTAPHPLGPFTEQLSVLPTGAETPELVYVPEATDGQTIHLYGHGNVAPLDAGNGQSTGLWTASTLEPGNDDITFDRIAIDAPSDQTELRGTGRHTGLYGGIEKRGGLWIARTQRGVNSNWGRALWYSYDGKTWRLDPTRGVSLDYSWSAERRTTSFRSISWRGQHLVLGNSVDFDAAEISKPFVARQDPETLRPATPPQIINEASESWEYTEYESRGAMGAMYWQGTLYIHYATTDRAEINPSSSIGCLYEDNLHT